MTLCTFEGCGLKHMARGLCRGHYGQWRRGYDLKPLRHRNEGKVCAFDKCERAAKTRSYCAAHYHQYRTGVELRPIGPTPWTAERVVAEATPLGECLLFGTNQVTRYPQVRYQGGNVSAHRLVYAGLIGEIPQGVHIHHTCGNSYCVKPDHLQMATAAENTLEMLARKSYEARIAALEARVKELEAQLEMAEGVRVA